MRGVLQTSTLLFGLAALGCAAHAPQLAHPSALADHDGREVRLVGVYRGLSVEARVGDPSAGEGWVVLWVGDQPIRFGLAPRPAEERDRWLDTTVEVRGLFQLKAPATSGGPTVPPALRDLPLLEPLAAPMAPP